MYRSGRPSTSSRVQTYPRSYSSHALPRGGNTPAALYNARGGCASNVSSASRRTPSSSHSALRRLRRFFSLTSRVLDSAACSSPTSPPPSRRAAARRRSAAARPKAKVRPRVVVVVDVHAASISSSRLASATAPAYSGSSGCDARKQSTSRDASSRLTTSPVDVPRQHPRQRERRPHTARRDDVTQTASPHSSKEARQQRQRVGDGRERRPRRVSKVKQRHALQRRGRDRDVPEGSQLKGASGVELKGVIGSGFETERRREVNEVLKESRPPRRRGRMGTGVV
eukprot:28408-Pelagococcus_subviridis.AAC.2